MNHPPSRPASPLPGPRRTPIIVVSAVASVIAISAIVTTIVLLTGARDSGSWTLAPVLSTEPAPPTPSGSLAPAASADMSTPSRPTTSEVESGTDLAEVEKLAPRLQANLNYKNVDGLMQAVCADGKAGGAARADLLQTIPALDTAHLDHAIKIHFYAGAIEPDPSEGFHVAFTGTYADGSDRSVTVVFRVYVDNGQANWCGVSRMS